jgi:hypothetical protein
MAIRWRGASGRTRECTELTVEGDRGFESIFLQRRVVCEPDWCRRDLCWNLIGLVSSRVKILGQAVIEPGTASDGIRGKLSFVGALWVPEVC